MRVTRVPEDEPPARPPEAVVAIGNFDGVHRGHRYLIGTAVARAAALGVQSAVVTFDPHPRLVLRPHVPLRLLSTVQDKTELVEALGVDHLLIWRFDRATQQTSAEQFFEQLHRRVCVRRVVHGPGFALGRQRQGTAAVIAEIGGWLGFDVEQVAPLRAGAVALAPAGAPPAGSAPGAPEWAQPVSSTAIRRLVQEGKIAPATAALGRPPTLVGTVVPGERLGQSLGFPTANVRLDGPLAVPADGVYAAWAELRPYTTRAARVPAAVSIGSRPTFGGAARVVEAYLLDFAGDLYGQALRLHFVARLRGQERFERVESLLAQMRRDVATTRALLVAESADDALVAADG